MLMRGDVIDLEVGHQVFADIPKKYVFSNAHGSEELVHWNVVIGGDFSHLAGRYGVYFTVWDGEVTGHGEGDSYEKGYHVFCEKVGDPSTKVDFYQTGDFVALIKDIQPIGEALLGCPFCGRVPKVHRGGVYHECEVLGGVIEARTVVVWNVRRR